MESKINIVIIYYAYITARAGLHVELYMVFTIYAYLQISCIYQVCIPGMHTRYNIYMHIPV